jgi:hypothetical protein
MSEGELLMNLLSYSRRGRPATYRHALGQAFINAAANGSFSGAALQFLDIGRDLTTHELRASFARLPAAVQRDVLTAISA